MRQILMAAAIMIAMGGCKAGEQGNDMVRVTDSDLKRETRPVGNFESVTLIGSYDVVYSQGKTTKVEVVAPSNVMDKITTEVKNRTLTISTKKIAGVTVITRTPNDVTVYVTSPVLRNVSLIGSGDFTAQGQIKADLLTLGLQGSGDMDFSNVECKSITANLQGSGDIKIGKVNASETAKLHLQGSGDFEVGTVDSYKLTANLQGSGDMEINRVSSAEFVSATLMGSGDMTLSSLNCNTLDVKQHGGDVKIGNVKATKSNVTLMGSGDMTLSSLDCNTLDVKQHGGDVKIGNVKATKSNVTLMGSGDMAVDFGSCSNLTAILYGSGDIKLTGVTDMYSRQKGGSGNIYDNNLKRSRFVNVGSNAVNSTFSPNGIEAQP